jgi:hypothetical protein
MSENKKFTIEELAAIKYPLEVGYGVYDRNCEIENLREAYVEGYKLAQEQNKNKYSEEDLEVAFFEGQFGKYSFNDWFEQFKKK